MSGSASIAFVVHEFASWADMSGVAPLVGGVSLLDLVVDFEKRQGFDAPGGYAPLTSWSETMSAYYLGEIEKYCWSAGKTALLGCDCGEMGCWPLCCRVRAGSRTVVWSDFEQPHRAERDDSGFGPFVFDRDEHEAALATLARGAS